MCGIAGLVVAPPAAVAASRLVPTAGSLAHRGPDDVGILIWSRDGTVERGRTAAEVRLKGQVGLIHRRLSILDLTTGGWQPMALADGRYFAVYNGEIYNFVELRAELEKAGGRFASASDTEVMLAAWRRWGHDALQRFAGMFAFALLDLTARQIILARDPFGIKPLYWTRAEGGIAFASEIKALRTLTGQRLRADPGALADYLLTGQSDVGASTMFQDIWRVPPGHVAVIPLDRPDQIEVSSYVRPPVIACGSSHGADMAAEVRRRFLDSVALHLRSDVPVGIALSGGIDSASALAAARLIAGTRTELHAFTYVSNDAAADEEAYADLAAHAAGAVHHKIHISAADLHRDLDDLIACQEEPFASTSIYAQFAVYRRVRSEGIKVVLDGQGADELLGGYPVFQAARLADLIRAADLAGARRLIAGVPVGTRRWVLKRAATMLLPRVLARQLETLLTCFAPPSWLNMEWCRAVGVADLLGPIAGQARGVAALRLETLTRTSLPALLRYNDRNGMHFGVESRVPFLEPRLVELLETLPSSDLIGPDAMTKNAFRRAMAGLVPAAILARRDKIGFATPEHEWLLTQPSQIDSIINNERARAIPVFRHDQLKRQWQQIRAGRRPAGRHLWRWINLIRWADLLDVEFPANGSLKGLVSRRAKSAPVEGTVS